jgi:hypothetical protein
MRSKSMNCFYYHRAEERYEIGAHCVCVSEIIKTEK